MNRQIILGCVLALTAMFGMSGNALAGDGDGACCQPDGSCIETTFIDCESSGGGFLGVGETCAANDCMNITGGCCLPGGECTSLTFPMCSAGSGTAWLPGADCEAGNVCPGACCFNDGTPCTILGQGDCADFGGFFQGNGTKCEAVFCEPFGACCNPDGTCEITFEDGCDVDPDWEAGSDCSECPTPTGACCFPTGDCMIAEEEDCDGMGGDYQDNGSDCLPNLCPQPPPTGACCLADGVCRPNSTQVDCEDTGGDYQGDETGCDPTPCIIPPDPGACCFSTGACTDGILPLACAALGGSFQGGNTDCGSVTCPIIPARPSGSEKGSLLAFSKVDLRWNASGTLVQDTIISISNDATTDVEVLMYFVNGDDPLLPHEGEPAHPGWNYIDVKLPMTSNQPAWWSAGTGFGSVIVPPFSILDPGDPPGRPDGNGDRVLRGFIYAWAVDAEDMEIRHNHLSGNAVIVNYRNDTAWEYNTWAHKRLTSDAGDADLMLDGTEYTESFALLLMNFQASGSSAYSVDDSMMAVSDTDVTLHPVGADLRPDEPGLPVTVKASYDVWNANEFKLSGAFRCITCWDQTFLSDYGIPNHFMLSTLQTDQGKARIDGIESPVCNVGGAVSEDEPLLGLVARRIYFMGGGGGGGEEGNAAEPVGVMQSGTNLIGMGIDATASIQYRPVKAPPEAPVRSQERR